MNNFDLSPSRTGILEDNTRFYGNSEANLSLTSPITEYSLFPNANNLTNLPWQPGAVNHRLLVSWSGGKDCCLSCYLAMLAGLDIRCLLSVIDHTGRLGAHSLAPQILHAQAEAIGIPLVIRQVQVSEYDADYCRIVKELKEQEGISGGVFGDVNIGNSEAKLHETWVKRIGNSAGIQTHLPLWNINRENILRMLISYGFEVLMIVTDNSELGKEWLGRRIDMETLAELKSRYESSENGRVGYYHTLVVDGPIFQKKLQIEKASKIFKGDEWGVNWYLDIEKCSLSSKH